ncbi:MAG: 1,4-alpha-glucan branching protein domain-containing protein [Chloroflexales bacterium]
MFVSFLIIAHAPYLRRAGRQPAGEEPLHEMIAQGLIPLLDLLGDLQLTGLGPRIAMACSPLLIEQLADPVVQKHFLLWMEERLARRSENLRHFELEENHHDSYLARFYLEWSRQALHSFTHRYNRNLAQRLRELTTARVIEPLAGAASHAYLPLLGREESVRVQIEHGALHTARSLGRPEGMWLPGSGWRPGIETAISNVGVRYVVLDRSSLPSDAGCGPIIVEGCKLIAIAPDEQIARHIWMPELGYVGDPLYRDPSDPGGYQAIGLGAPQPYDPYHALRRAQEHASHFAGMLISESDRRSPNDILLVLLDMDLIGTAWFEGPTWLQAVMTLCATHRSLKLTTPGEYLKSQRPRQRATIRAGSWGAGGHAPWRGPSSESYWQAIHAAEEKMVQIAAEFPSAEADQERTLNQAARELMLAQTSDWPEALVATGYAEEQRERWQIYLGRFDQLMEMARLPTISHSDRFLLDQLEELDGPFPNLNYRVFVPHEKPL